ncbi:hypothetical protein HOL21_00830 [Candidatus Woesearchaeota archaeon]|jgi:hypothetical protein|nr:hypothetical protein [Candidatus Woesearchaeota archaeon]MBT5396739.1 hypothetical protein [Candidatus Woesearchaeota archaeon]MBT6367627.1 hypothetical protein [Candidatus Woesearchaeota archaeon]MBT7762973.1 hypothetical protein [Candidatus Woesearchaeota archaeon]
MTDQDKILNFLRVTGPTLPSKVAKNIGSEILIASAHLSDLNSQRKLRISNLKVGGSPLYYLPGQEEQLYPFAAGNMNAKDAAVLDMLKERKVLRESDLDLLAKVALRSLKDFAVPLQVTVKDTKELFWKWNFCSDEETNTIIKKILGVKEPQPVEAPVQPEVQQEESTPVPEPVKAELIKEEPIPAEEPVEAPAVELTPEPINEEAEPVKEKPKEPVKEKVEKNVELKEESKPAQQPEEPQKEKSKQEKQKTLEPEKPKKPLFKKLRDKITRQKRVPVEDTFLPQIESFFTKLKINVDQKEMVRKNAELNFHIKVPTAVGDMMYFCKAKSKNKADEKDLSAAYMEAQMKKLPLLFLYTKEINKKAEEMIDSGAFENAIIKKIE